MTSSNLRQSSALLFVVLIGVASLCFATRSPASEGAAQDKIESAPARIYPSLPGAVRECPEWLKKNAPFDVAEWFEVVPPEENAARIYLDALYEFAPQDMVRCMAPAAVATRGAVIHSRVVRTNAGLTAMPPLLSRDLVAEYVVAFDKLVLAQRHQRCVFETGIGWDTVLPHAQSSRAVIRVLDWRVEYAVRDGRIDQAIADVNLGLRLSRDLRPRGCIISQLVSIALDSVILRTTVPRILGAKGLTVAQCDRLLRVLAQQDEEARDSLSEGFRAEYVFMRDILHRYETGDETVAALMLDKKVASVLEGFTDADFAAEVDALNRFFRPLVERRRRPVWEYTEVRPEQQRAPLELKALAPMLVTVPQVVEARLRDLIQIPALRCLVAVRRWQLGHSGQAPPDLFTACQAAGIKAVPLDEYSPTGEPLRFTTIDSEFVVYSVAKDGVDDGAKMDWNFGRTPGDWAFRLPPAP